MANRLIHEAKKQDRNQIMFCSFETVAHNHDKANEAAPLSRQSLEFETTPLRSALDTPMRTREEERKRRAYRVERYEED